MVLQILKIIKSINGFLWGPAALIFLGLIGIYLTIGTKGVHIRKFKLILSKTIGKIGKK